MNLALNGHEAWRALRANALRSVLTMLGVILGVAAVIVMVAIGAGTQQRIQQEIEQLGTNTLIVAPARLGGGADRAEAGARQRLTAEDARAIDAEVPGLVATAPVVRGQARTVLGNANWSTVVEGTTESFFQAREWELEDGRVFDGAEAEMGRKVVLLGQTVADKLFREQDPIDRTIRIDHLSFRVIGVLQPKGQTMDGFDLDDVVVMPLATAQNHLLGRAAGRASAVNSIVVKADPHVELSALEHELKLLLRDRHRLSEGQEDSFGIHNMAAALEVQEASSSAMTTLLAAVASISLLVGGIGIMNIMLVSVTERTREIGIRGAIGAGPRDLLAQFLTEAVTLSLIGALLGVMLGVAGSVLAQNYFGIGTHLTLGPILLASLFAAGVGVLFGFYPALKASRLTPIEALRHG